MKKKYHKKRERVARARIKSNYGAGERYSCSVFMDFRRFSFGFFVTILQILFQQDTMEVLIQIGLLVAERY